jgi:hypothetical protein
LLTYLKYILIHKYYVFVFGLQYNVPLWQLLIHDWTKFLPSELFAYQRYFYRDKQSNKEAFQVAWNHHQKRNPHHWQYWILLKETGETIPLEMPAKYVREMVADWTSAGFVQNGKIETWAWYYNNRRGIILHPNTRQLVEMLLLQGDNGTP